MMRLGVAAYEILGKHLHITCQHNEINSISVENLKFALLHFGLVLSCHGNVLERYVELLPGNGEVGVIADDNRDLHIPFPCHIACEHIVETVRHLAHEYSHFLPSGGEAQTVEHFVARRIKSVEIFIDFFCRNHEVFQIPLDTHIEYTVDTIHILVEIDNVAAVCGDKICDNGYDARLVGAVHAKYGGRLVFTFHLSEILLIELQS